MQPRIHQPQESVKMCGTTGADQSSDSNSEISLKDFLDFLCTAYQVSHLVTLEKLSTSLALLHFDILFPVLRLQKL